MNLFVSILISSLVWTFTTHCHHQLIGEGSVSMSPSEAPSSQQFTSLLLNQSTCMTMWLIRSWLVNWNWDLLISDPTDYHWTTILVYLRTKFLWMFHFWQILKPSKLYCRGCQDILRHFTSSLPKFLCYLLFVVIFLVFFSFHRVYSQQIRGLFRSTRIPHWLMNSDHFYIVRLSTVNVSRRSLMSWFSDSNIDISTVYTCV